MAGTLNNKAGEQARSCPPRHIAIILHGNGRWAKERGLPRTAGHSVGSENFRKIATYCKNIGVEYLTVYAFSTELEASAGRSQDHYEAARQVPS